MKAAFAVSFLCLIVGLIGFIFHAFGREKKYFRTATYSTIVSVLALTVLIILQGVKYGFRPVDYLAQPCNILAWLMLVAYFFAEYKFKIRILGALFIPIVAILMLIPAFTGQAVPESVQTLKSPFFINLHVALLLSSFAFFFLACAMAVIYIIKTRALKNHRSVALDDDLPSLGKLQKIFESTFNIGWITMTAGFILAILNIAVSDSSLHVDPKIIFGSSLWFIYSILFFAYQAKKIGTRNLARSVTFLFIAFLAFWIAFSANFIGPGSKPAAPTVEKGD